MSANALWLSMQEPVMVETVVESTDVSRYGSPRYQARRQDGSLIMIDRSDIILAEEQLLIDELAHILYNSKNPVQHERYSVIMRQFIGKGVPYVSWLRKRKPEQQTIDLFDAG